VSRNIIEQTTFKITKSKWHTLWVIQKFTR